MLQTAIGIVLVAAGIALFWRVIIFFRNLGSPRAVAPAPEQEQIEPVEPEGDVAGDGIVYMYAGRFVRPAARRAIGSIPRDRAFDLTTDTELDPRDFAQQVVYVTLTDLYKDGLVQFRLTARQPTFMPPFPNKSWELRVRQLDEFGGSPLRDSLNVAFEMIYKKQLARARRAGEDNVREDHLWVTLDELVEHALKAIRQEMSFWEKGSVYSDLRNYIGIGLTAQRFLVPPPQETWLDRMRRKSPSINPIAMRTHLLEERAAKLQAEVEAFRKRFASPAACEDPTWPSGEVDPALLSPTCPLDDLPLDDCLQVSIYETLISIRQLEPSGEAGI